MDPIEKEIVGGIRIQGQPEGEVGASPSAIGMGDRWGGRDRRRARGRAVPAPERKDQGEDRRTMPAEEAPSSGVSQDRVRFAARKGNGGTMKTMGILRIYLDPQAAAEGGFFRRHFGPPPFVDLLRSALAAGVVNATVCRGQVGFSRSRRRLCVDTLELGGGDLPVAMELVAPEPLLRRFVQQQASRLRTATVVLLSGQELTLEAHQTSLELSAS